MELADVDAASRMSTMNYSFNGPGLPELLLIKLLVDDADAVVLSMVVEDVLVPELDPTPLLVLLVEVT